MVLRFIRKEKWTFQTVPALVFFETLFSPFLVSPSDLSSTVFAPFFWDSSHRLGYLFFTNLLHHHHLLKITLTRFFSLSFFLQSTQNCTTVPISLRSLRIRFTLLFMKVSVSFIQRYDKYL